jgi:hypothetical protein
MVARYINTSRLCDHYAVEDPDRAHLVTVRHGCHPEQPFACLTCLRNDCKHIDAVETLILAGEGAPKTTNASTVSA